MPLNFTPQLTIERLPQAIKEMRDFLLNNPSSEEYYERLYDEIAILTIKARTEGYYNYKHRNSYKTLLDFLNQNNTAKLVEKYYSIPVWSKKLIKQPKIKKIVRSGKKFMEWIVDQITKFIPFKSS